MAIINFDGAEMGSQPTRLGSSGASTPATSGAGVPRTGTYALRLNVNGSTGSTYYGGLDATGRPAEMARTAETFYTFYLKFTSFPNAAAPGRQMVCVEDSGTSEVVAINVTSGGVVTLVGTSTSGTVATLSTGTYYRFNLRVTSNGTCGLSIDGGTELTVTGNNITQDRFRFGVKNSTIVDCYMDDMAISSSGFIADCAIYISKPIGAGTVSGGWTNGTSSTFNAVDETPPNTSDYIADSATTDNYRTFTMQSWATIGGTNQIAAVQAIAYMAEGTSTTTLGTVIIKSSAATAKPTDADIGTTAYGYISYIAETDPDTGIAWTTSGFNSIEVGAWKGNDASEIRASTIMLQVLTGTLSTTLTDVGSIASAEAFGTAIIIASISPTGIATAEAFGTDQINSALTLSGIASLEAFGSHVVAPGSVTILPSGIASSEAFGSLTAINVQIVTFTAGIDTLEAFGTLSIAPGSVTIAPDGIASLEAFGTLAVGSIISPTGIASLEAFGTLQINSALTLTGIDSLEAFGTAIIAATISPSGIASLEAFGTLIAKNVVIILPTGIDSLEAFGTAIIAATISPTGIASLEAFGTTVILRIVSPTGISSLEAFGTLSIAAGAVTIQPVGIVSAEAFGALVALLSVTDGAKPPPGFSVLTLPMGSGASPFNPIPPAGGSGASLWLPPGVGR